MAIKVIIFSCILSVAFAGFLPYYAQPSIIQPAILKSVQIAAAPEARANYDFNYDVNAAETGDAHSQRESAKDGVISGSYQLDDSDGFRRIVDYTADDVNGFQANVRRERLSAHPTIIKKIIAQPALTKYISAPVHAVHAVHVPIQAYQAVYHH